MSEPVVSRKSLRTSIMRWASAAVVALGMLVAAAAYQRLAEGTLKSAVQWSTSVAQLVVSSNTSAFILHDLSAIESNFQQVALLPGIDSVTLFRADGRELVTAYQKDGKVLTEVGKLRRMPIDLQGVQVIAGRQGEGFYEAWAPVLTGGQFPSAWVQVHFSLQQRHADLMRLWMGSGLGIALLAALLLASLHFILGRALQPLTDLALFARSMPRSIGSQTSVSRRYAEVDQLSVAINEASRSIAEHMGRTRAIFNTAGEAIVGLDANGKITNLNPVAQGFFGQSDLQMRGQPLQAYIPGLDLSALQEMFEDETSYYAGMSRIVRKDFYGERADGTLFPVEISLGKVTDIADLRYVCLVRDVTDERATLQFTELYERALACSHNAVFITNGRMDSNPIVYVNQALQDLLQLPLHEMLGKSTETLLGLSPTDAVLPELHAAFAEQRHTNLTLQLRAADQSVQVVELSLSPVRSDKGSLTNFIGIVLDVTARVQAEEVIATRSAQLDAIFSLSPDGFVLFDANHRLVFANPAFQRMTGHDGLCADHPMGLVEFETLIRDICDPAQAFVPLHEQGRGSQDWQARLHFMRPQRRVVQASARSNRAGSSETIFYFRDITHEDAVDRMKSEFLASAAHELRTPMVSIFGFTELLLHRSYTPERQKDMLGTMHRQSGLLVKMINELLDLARIESRRGLDLQIASHSLRDLIDGAVKGLMRSEADRQVQLGSIPQMSVLVDPGKMLLALNNLLSNAFKYSPDGGLVSVTAQIDQWNEESYAVIAVRDQGMGMSPGQLARAFERFYRADATGNIPGTGLGLSFVQEIAGLHNGRVELESALGQGTTARLWIPLDKKALAPRQGMAELVHI